MISVDKIAVIHGSRVLFQDVTVQIGAKDKVGLIGKNGAGKSTLLKIFAGKLKPESGTLSKPKELTVGYLPQEMPLPAGKTVYDETVTAFEEMMKLEKELDSVNHEIGTREDHQSDSFFELLNKQAELNERLQLMGWHEISEKVERVLTGLGFLPSDFEQPTDQFSGGWRMRIELAKVLLRNPGIVLLDEPTNHLDIESIQWLEVFLKNLQVPVLLISHDITFLNKVTNRTVEITDGRVYDLPLPYSKYQIRRKEMRETLMASKKNQDKKIKDAEAFINRFRAKASKARQVQSRIKLLDKMDVIEADEETIAQMNIRFPACVRSGKIVLEAKNVNKSFGDKHVIKNANFLLSRGEKIAFVGKNGAGKTTLSKMIVSELSHEGELKLGHQVKTGYYAQDQSGRLDPELDVYQSVEADNTELNPTELRSLLGAFLFSGDDQFKKVKVLSGGEKARLALCKLLLQPFNFLVLDEPTNHLDIQSKDILKNALKQFTGSLVVVSHDRDFLTGLTDKVFEFTDTGIREHIGDIADFLAIRKVQSLDDISGNTKNKKSAANQPEKDETQKNDYQERKEKSKMINQSKSTLSKVEKEIEKIEAKMEEINLKISGSSDYKPTLINEFEDLQRELEEQMKQWEKASLRLEKLEAD